MMEHKKIVFLTGSGISKESGLATFRDHDGLWEGYSIHEVASIDGWLENPKKVLDFYNERRIKAALALPNDAHLAIKTLESSFDVTIITQNVDDLHEKAQSKHIIHLHGSLFEAYPEFHPSEVFYIGNRPILLGERNEKGHQIRPNIVWFGEIVPLMEEAVYEAISADIFIIVGTSLLVYPAASLLQYVNEQAEVFVIDPIKPPINQNRRITFIEENASVGVPKLVEQLISQYYE